MNLNKIEKILSPSILVWAFAIPGIAQAVGEITNAPSIATILMNILSFFLSIAGGVAVLSLVISGVMYMLSGGDEVAKRTAKAAIGYSVTGIVVVLLSLAVVKTLSGLFAS